MTFGLIVSARIIQLLNSKFPDNTNDWYPCNQNMQTVSLRDSNNGKIISYNCRSNRHIFIPYRLGNGFYIQGNDATTNERKQCILYCIEKVGNSVHSGSLNSEGSPFLSQGVAMV